VQQPAGFSQQLFAAQPLLQPHPLIPSIRSRRSNAKVWVHRPRPSTNAPTKILNFIEPRLLNVGPVLRSSFSFGVSLRYHRRRLTCQLAALTSSLGNRGRIRSS
jgi:hypothetical protein